MKMTEFNYQISHIDGTSNKIADALSRYPAVIRKIDLSTSLSEQDHCDASRATLQGQDPELTQILFWKWNNPKQVPMGLKGAAHRYSQIW